MAIGGTDRQLVIGMKGKRPLVMLLAIMLSIGLMATFAAAPAAAQSDNDENENECEAEAENKAALSQNAVGAYITQGQTVNQNAQASINNFAKVFQKNQQWSTQQASGTNVAQSNNQQASNTAKVSQCEANQNA